MKYNLILQRPKTTPTSVQFVSFVAGKRFLMSTEVQVPTSKWKPKSKGVKAGLDIEKHPEEVVKAAQIREAVNLIIEAHDEIVFMKQDLTVANWRERVLVKRGAKKPKEEFTLNEYVDEVMEAVKGGKRFTPNGTTLRESSTKRYVVVQNLIEAFCNEKNGRRKLLFKDITPAFVNEWKRWRADGVMIGRRQHRQPVSSNVVRGDLKILRMWMKESYHQGLHENRIWEGEAMRMKELPATIFHLTPDELEKIWKADLTKLRKGKKGPKSTAHETVRNMFLMSCWTGGRISDVKRYPAIVMEAWRENGNSCPESIEYVQQKTNTLVKVPIIEHAQDVINHYKGALPKMPNDAKVNRLLKDVLKAAGIDRTIQLRNTSIDGPTHEVASIAEIVSFHTGRRSFATNIYNSNAISLGELRALTGHKSEAMLMKYLNVTQTEVSERATDRLLSAFNRKT